MGIKHIATSVELVNGKTMFYGKDLNHVRGWYFWLRRQLGLKKAIDTIKKIGDHEKRIAYDIIHKITREIVGIMKAIGARNSSFSDKRSY